MGAIRDSGKFAPLVKGNSSIKSDRVNLFAPSLSIELDTVQTGTGKVDPAWKFKCTTAERGFYTK